MSTWFKGQVAVASVSYLLHDECPHRFMSIGQLKYGWPKKGKPDIIHSDKSIFSPLKHHHMISNMN